MFDRKDLEEMSASLSTLLNVNRDLNWNLRKLATIYGLSPLTVFSTNLLQFHNAHCEFVGVVQIWVVDSNI